MNRQRDAIAPIIEAALAQAWDEGAQWSATRSGYCRRAANRANPYIAGDPPAVEICRVGHELYGACELPYRHDGPHSRVPGGATEPNTWVFDAGDPPATPPRRLATTGIPGLEPDDHPFHEYGTTGTCGWIIRHALRDVGPERCRLPAEHPIHTPAVES